MIINRLDNQKVPRHPSFLLKIKNNSPSLSLPLSLPASGEEGVRTLASIKPARTARTLASIKPARTYGQRILSVPHSFSQSVSQHA